MPATDDGALAFWRISQRYHAMTSVADQEAYLNGTVRPFLAASTNHVQIKLLRKFLNEVDHAGGTVRTPLVSG